MNQKRSLPLQILLALALGVLVGLLCSLGGFGGLTALYLKPFGDIFVNLLKFIVVPVVLLSMTDGILSMNDMRKVGSIGIKTVAYFTVTTAIACVIGLTFASLFNSAGLFPVLDPAGAAYEAQEFGGFMSVLVGIFPTNLWTAFSEANMLQVIVISLLFGGAILAAGERARPVRELAGALYAVVERLMAFIIRLAPIGVFAYMAWVTATQGSEILVSLLLVIACAYLGYTVHAVVVYALSARLFTGMSPLAFFRGVFAAMIFAFTSASSAATLPVARACVHEMGADDGVAAFVLPLGATINMDGTAIYQCVAAVFIASCAGMQLTLGQMVLVVITATLSSIGTAGVSGAGMLMLALVLETLNIPVDYIGLIVAVDRIFDMGRTCLNVTGDMACTLCVSRWERRR